MTLNGFPPAPSHTEPYGPVFDSYVIVDWSASSKPKTGKDSIWVAVADRSEGLHVKTTNVPTRARAILQLEELLQRFCATEKRTLIGFDFPFGYPFGFARAARGCQASKPPWRATWDLLVRKIQDDDRNRSNRFAVASAINEACGFVNGPFWGCPKGAEGKWLEPTAPKWQTLPLRKHRHTESCLLRERRLVQEAWKLFTTGSVGSQSLVGIPRVAALRDSARLQSFGIVWPFETGFAVDQLRERKPLIVYAEIWPGIISLGPLDGRVKDDAQVESLCRHFAQLDTAGLLHPLFGPPPHLDEAATLECLSEEGWILGSWFSSSHTS